MKLAIILLLLCSAVVVFTAAEEEHDIFHLSRLLNPRQADENITAAIVVCNGPNKYGKFGPSFSAKIKAREQQR